MFKGSLNVLYFSFHILFFFYCCFYVAPLLSVAPQIALLLRAYYSNNFALPCQ